MTRATGELPRSRRLVTSLLVVVLTLAIVPFVGSSPPQVAAQSGSVPSGDVIVVLNAPGIDPADFASGFGVQAAYVYESALVGFSANLTQAAAERLIQSQAVQGIYQDLDVFPSAQEIPTGVDRVNADTNPIASIDGVDNPINADVAILDTGVDSVADLNVVGGINIDSASYQGNQLQCSTSTSQGSFSDSYGHGTHVAGTIGARDNDSGVVGVAPGVRIYAVRVLTTGNGGGTISQLICGIDWVTANAGTIDIANMSLVTGGTSAACGSGSADALHQAICNSVNAGVTYVAAAGNGSGNIGNTAPAMYPEVIAVTGFSDFDGLPGGLDPSPPCTSFAETDDTFYTGSKYGASADIMAPATCIKSIRVSELGGGLSFRTGTSMASAHVAGAAALFVSTNPGASPAAVRGWLLSSGSVSQVEAGITGDPDGISEPVLMLGPVSGETPTPTLTPTNSPTPSPTGTATNTPVPPTATNTPISPTATNTATSVPPTATNTPVPPTATNTATNTPIPPTATNTPAPPTATVPAGPFMPLDLVQTTANLNMRVNPGLGSSVVATLPFGTQATVLSVGVQNGAYLWYEVDAGPYGSGWVASNWLVKIGVATPTATPSATSTSGPATNTPIAPTPTATPSGLAPGDLAQTTANLNFRVGPGLQFASIGVLTSGSTVTILSFGQPSGAYTWYQVDSTAFGTGWVAGEFLVKIGQATPTPTAAPPTATATVTGGWPSGSTVQVDVALNMRSGPATTNTVVAVLLAGQQCTVLSGPVVNVWTWYQLDCGGSGTGWSAGEYLTLISSSASVSGASEEVPEPSDTEDSAGEAEPTQPVETPETEPTVESLPEPTATADVVEQPEELASEDPVEPTIEEPVVDDLPEPYQIVRVQRTDNAVSGAVLVDHDLSTAWVTTSAEVPRIASFALDLDSTLPVGTLLWLQGESGILGRIVIHISNDGQDWTEILVDGQYAIGQWSAVDLDVETRFIRFAFLNEEGIPALGGIAEVEVWPSGIVPVPFTER